MASEEKRNLLWLITEHGLRMIIGVVVGAVVARHIGVSDFGQLMVAGGYAALLVPLVNLGLLNVLVSECVKHPSRDKFVLGNALLMQIPLSLIIYGLVFSIYYCGGQNSVSFLVLLVCTHLPFQTIMVIQAYHQYKKTLHLYAKASTLAFFISAVLRLLCVYYDLPVEVFAFLLGLETALAFLLIMLISKGDVFFLASFKVSIRIMRRLFSLSWVQVVMAFGLILVGRVDMIALQLLSTDQELGIFSAALRISERVNFLPLIISATFLPKVIGSKKLGLKEYENNLRSFLDMHAFLAMGFAMFIMLFGEMIATIMYGEEYSGTGELLLYQAWVAVPFFLGMAKWNYLIVEKNLRDNLLTIAAVLVIKTTLTLFLVPKYGAHGVVISSLISYTLAFVFLTIISSRTRLFGKYQVCALTSFLRVKEMKQFISGK